MRDRRVTVIGASGFLGRYVVRRLARQGAVIAAVSRRAGDAGYLKPMGDVGQIALIDGDIGQEDVIRAALADADGVVNCVGILWQRGAQSFERVHHQAAGRLAELAAAAGVGRMVHLSAIGADPGSPAAYARSKAAGEDAVRRAFPDAVILRPSIVFGPEDQFFNRFAEMARFLPLLPLLGGGATRLQPVYVGDVADAVVAALDGVGGATRLFELGGPQVLTFREAMELLLHEIGRRRMLVAVPAGLARLMAYIGEYLPEPPLTRDQLLLLERDNVVSAGMPGLPELGIAPTALELVLPTYLDRFRRPGALTTA
jgi:uncharacterized protein YbjT (DUF2867 family)